MEFQKKENVYSAQGLVLSSVNYGEAHRIFTLLTPDEGLLSVMAYGVRKIKSKLRGGIEPLNVVDLQIKKQSKTGFLTVQDLTVIKSYSNLMEYSLLWELFPFLRFLRYLHFSSEDENKKSYQMILKFLDIAVQQNEIKNLKLLEYTLVLKLLITLSLAGNFKYCGSCHKELTALNETVYFEREAHLLFCGNCRRIGVENFIMKPSFHQLILKLIYSRFEEVINLGVENKKLGLFRELIDIIIEETLGKRWSDFEIQENPFDYQSQIGKKQSQEGQGKN